MSTVSDLRPSRSSGQALQSREIALVDLLDRVLAGGVVITGEITLSIADIDLVRISLRALVASVRQAVTDADERGLLAGETDPGAQR